MCYGFIIYFFVLTFSVKNIIIYIYLFVLKNNCKFVNRKNVKCCNKNFVIFDWSRKSKLTDSQFHAKKDQIEPSPWIWYEHVRVRVRIDSVLTRKDLWKKFQIHRWITENSTNRCFFGDPVFGLLNFPIDSEIV